MRMQTTVLALALLLVPAMATAQEKPATRIPHSGPIQGLLQHRSDLALTGDQVQKLEAIQQKNAAREQELVDRITAGRGVPPGTPTRSHAGTVVERQAHRQAMQAVRPQVDELRTLHQAQIQEARAILTADQNARAWGGRGQGPVRPHDGKASGRMRHGTGGPATHGGVGASDR